MLIKSVQSCEIPSTQGGGGGGGGGRGQAGVPLPRLQESLEASCSCCINMLYFVT